MLTGSGSSSRGSCDSLPDEPVPQGARFPIAHPHHPAWIGGVNGPWPLWVRDAHLENPVVPIQVLGRVLVDPAVSVFVVGPDVPPVVLRRVHRYGASVRIHDGDDVERTRIDELGNSRIRPVPREQSFQEGEGPLAREHFPPVDIPIYVETWLLGLGARCGVVDVHSPDRAVGPTPSDLMQCDELGITFSCGLEVRLDFSKGVVMIEDDERLLLRERCLGHRQNREEED